MKVLSVASEAYPLIKTGGLADVAGALPAALSAFGVDMKVLLPAYPAVMEKIKKPRKSKSKKNKLLGIISAILCFIVFMSN